MSDDDDAAMYGLTLSQFKDARTVAQRPKPWAVSNSLLALYMKYPEPTWNRVVAAVINMRRMGA